MADLVNDLAERFDQNKCRYRHGNKKCEACGIKHKFSECCLEYTNVKTNLIEYKCLYCNKNYQKSLIKFQIIDLLIQTKSILLL